MAGQVALEAALAEALAKLVLEPADEEPADEEPEPGFFVTFRNLGGERCRLRVDVNVPLGLIHGALCYDFGHDPVWTKVVVVIGERSFNDVRDLPFQGLSGVHDIEATVVFSPRFGAGR